MLANSMTKNLIEFLSGPLRSWIQKYSDGDILGAFGVIPCDRGANEFNALCQEGLTIFANTAWEDVIVIDDCVLGTFQKCGDRYYCLYSQDTTQQMATADNFSLQACKLHFLQVSTFLVLGDLQPTKVIPSRLITGDTFEADIQEYYPEIYSFRLIPEAGSEHVVVTYIRSFLSIEPTKSPISSFANDIIDLALSIPETGHDWLLYQVLGLVRSKRKENLYLELYKLLEFFFPIANIHNLKRTIAYSGTPLQLLESCQQQLNWNVNHNYGVRASLRYASHNFAEILTSKTLTFDAATPQAEREKSISALKTEAMESLSKLRHALTHQNFKTTVVDNDTLFISTRALLAFLSEAFSSYKREVLSTI